MDTTILQSLTKITIPCKYTSWYIALIKSASILTPSGYTEKHHIIPKSFNTLIENNTIIGIKENIVILTARQHFIAHLLLLKMFNNPVMKKKMNYAFFQLRRCNKYQKRYLTSRLYEIIKKEKREYYRLYKDDKVYYIDIENEKYFNELISEGASLIMPDTYKECRVGNMKGRKHSNETKQKMSMAAKQYERPWLMDVTNEEYVRRAKKGVNTKQARKNEDPNYYAVGNKTRGEKIRNNFKCGLTNVSGENNSRFGAIVLEETKQKIADRAQRRLNHGLSHREIYDLYIVPNLERGLNANQISKIFPYKKSPHSIRILILKFRAE